MATKKSQETAENLVDHHMRLAGEPGCYQLLIESIAFALDSVEYPNETNPDHPVTAAVRDQWHKIAGIILYKECDATNIGPDGELTKEVVITSDDLDRIVHAFGGAMPAVVIHEKKDGIHVRLMSAVRAARLVVQ